VVDFRLRFVRRADWGWWFFFPMYAAFLFDFFSQMIDFQKIFFAAFFAADYLRKIFLMCSLRLFRVKWLFLRLITPLSSIVFLLRWCRQLIFISSDFFLFFSPPIFRWCRCGFLHFFFHFHYYRRLHFHFSSLQDAEDIFDFHFLYGWFHWCQLIVVSHFVPKIYLIFVAIV